MRMKSMLGLLAAAVVLVACSPQKSETSMPNISDLKTTSDIKTANGGVPVIMGHTYTVFSKVLGMDRPPYRTPAIWL